MAGFLITNRPASRKFSILAQVCFGAEWGRAYNGGQPILCGMNMQLALNSVRFAPEFPAFSTQTHSI